MLVPVQTGPAPSRTPAPHSARATGDPRDSLLARETNQPQDPGCLGANSKARIICLAHMPVGSTDLEDTSRLLPSHELHTAPMMVAESQRTWQKTITRSRHGGVNLPGVTEAHIGRTHLDMRSGQRTLHKTSDQPKSKFKSLSFCKDVKELMARMLICC